MTMAGYITVREEPIHGVECYEAWREWTPCPHERNPGEHLVAYEREVVQEVEAALGSVADLRGKTVTDLWVDGLSAECAIKRLFAALDCVSKQYRYMLHLFALACEDPEVRDERRRLISHALSDGAPSDVPTTDRERVIGPD